VREAQQLQRQILVRLSERSDRLERSLSEPPHATLPSPQFVFFSQSPSNGDRRYEIASDFRANPRRKRASAKQREISRPKSEPLLRTICSSRSTKVSGVRIRPSPPTSPDSRDSSLQFSDGGAIPGRYFRQRGPETPRKPKLQPEFRDLSLWRDRSVPVAPFRFQRARRFSANGRRCESLLGGVVKAQENPLDAVLNQQESGLRNTMGRPSGDARPSLALTRQAFSGNTMEAG
jgi:hypothetical protein